jgi:hypothetical protein
MTTNDGPVLDFSFIIRFKVTNFMIKRRRFHILGQHSGLIVRLNACNGDENVRAVEEKVVVLTKLYVHRYCSEVCRLDRRAMKIS